MNLKPDEHPTVSRGSLPRTDLQAVKIGMMATYLLCKGYTLRPLPESKNPSHIFGTVEHEGVPVALLSFVGDDQAGFAHTAYGLQFIYDTRALTGSEHWPKPGPLFEPQAEPEAAEEWVVVEGDSSIHSTLAPTPEAAAAMYFGEEVWDRQHDARPDAVTVGRVVRPTYRSFAEGHARTVADEISEAMFDQGGEWAEDACRAVESQQAQDELERRLAPVIEGWLRETLPGNGGLSFYSITDTREVPAPEVTP